MYAAPLSVMREVIRTNSVEFMPLPLSVMSFLNSTVWSLYGFYLLDPYLGVPNCLGVILSTSQVRLSHYQQLPSKYTTTSSTSCTINWFCQYINTIWVYAFLLSLLFSYLVTVVAIFMLPPWGLLKRQIPCHKLVGRGRVRRRGFLRIEWAIFRILKYSLKFAFQFHLIILWLHLLNQPF